MTQLTPQQNDMLTELANIGMGHAASTLNNLIGHRVRLQVPSVEIISHAHPALTGDGSVAAVSMGFRGSFSGNAALMFPAESAAILVAALTGEAPDADLSEELRAGTLAEVGNILLNGVMGSICNMITASLQCAVPEYHESSLRTLLGRQPAETVLMAQALFYIDELRIEGNILLFFELESFLTLIEALDAELCA